MKRTTLALMLLLAALPGIAQQPEILSVSDVVAGSQRLSCPCASASCFCDCSYFAFSTHPTRLTSTNGSADNP